MGNLTKENVIDFFANLWIKEEREDVFEVGGETITLKFLENAVRTSDRDPVLAISTRDRSYKYLTYSGGRLRLRHVKGYIEWGEVSVWYKKGGCGLVEEYNAIVINEGEHNERPN